MCKTTSLCILVAVFLLSCNGHKQENTTVSDSLKVDSVAVASEFQQENREIELTSIFLPLPDNEGKLLVEITYSDNKISVYNESDTNNPIQVLGPVETNINFSDKYYSENPLEIFNPEDINFDGYKDLKILLDNGSMGNRYGVFLYEPAKKSFVYKPQFEELISLETDSATHTLKTFNNGGMAGAWYTSQRYRWQGQELILIREESQTSDQFEDQAESLERTILKRNEKNKMDTVAEATIYPSSTGKETWCLTRGNWSDFEEYSDPLDNIIKMDGRNGGCKK